MKKIWLTGYIHDRARMDAINIWSSRDNQSRVHDALGGGPEFTAYAREFAGVLRSELGSSAPIVDIGVDEQVRRYNTRFANYIATRRRPMGPVLYSINDGLPLSQLKNMSPNDTLKAWQQRPGRPTQSRDDTAARASSHIGGGYGYGSGGGGAAAITFCDQSEYGVNYHVIAHDSPLRAAMNDCDEYLKTPYGVSTPAADARFLSRRIGGFAMANPHQKRMHRRNVERDLDEVLCSPQHDGTVRGFDMAPLRARIEQKRSINGRCVQ